MSRQVLVEWESETEIHFTHPYDRALFARLTHMFGKPSLLNVKCG